MKILNTVNNLAVSARVLGGAGIVRPMGPATLAGLGRTLKDWGTGPAGGFIAMAVREPKRIALIDELGELTYGDLDRRSNALARGLAELGVGEGDSVAVMCRNHRGFVDATVAAAKLGADIVYLNTAFAGPQLVDVLEREGPQVVVHDEEFTELLEKAEVRTRVLAWVDEPTEGSLEAMIEQGIEAGQDGPLDPPERHSRIIILTSGTTGTPKGAPRNEAGIDAAVSLMSRLPLRYGWRTHIAAPLFHTWGLAHLMLGMLLGSTVVIRRKFEPEAALELTQKHRCDSLVVIPVMLQRILGQDDETLDKYDLPTLKVVAASGSARRSSGVAIEA
jgi:fatty-acyl-CoA synthase